MGRRRRVAGFAAGMVFVIAVAACSSGPDVAADELSAVIARDGIVFEDGHIPASVVDRLAEHRVVVLGETHHLREHWNFTAELLVALHDRGFRQLLVERPQMNDWLLDDYVLGGALEPDWVPPPYFQRRFAAIRAFNDTLPPGERIHVRSIDVNGDFYGGAADFVLLAGWLVDHLPDAGPVGAFLQADYSSADAQASAIDALLLALETDRAVLTETWGRQWYDSVLELAEVERTSIDIRDDSDDNRATRAREDLIKDLVDRRISGYPHGTVINIGAHHAQKAPLMGTEQEWLGDYLVHSSAAPGGSVIVVRFSPAKTELLPGAGGTPFDVVASSPEHELYRLMAEARPGQTVFLPLDDPMFGAQKVALNSEETIYDAVLKDHFDALVQYGLAHRMPID